MTMMLGELIAGLERQSVAEDAVLALGDITLLAAVEEIAARNHETVGAVIVEAVGTFVGTAGPDAWMAAMRAASDSAVPGSACLEVMLEHALPQLHAALELRGALPPRAPPTRASPRTRFQGLSHCGRSHRRRH